MLGARRGIRAAFNFNADHRGNGICYYFLARRVRRRWRRRQRGTTSGRRQRRRRLDADAPTFGNDQHHAGHDAHAALDGVSDDASHTPTDDAANDTTDDAANAGDHTHARRHDDDCQYDGTLRFNADPRQLRR